MATKVIIITGPCGVGKSTISRLIARDLNCELIVGDAIKDELFPSISYITQYPEKLKIVKETLFQRSEAFFAKGKTVVIDYVIVGESYTQRFQERFGNSLIIKVLLPLVEVIYERDETRDCWQAGREVIDFLYQRYLELKPFIGEENYINNEKETPERNGKTPIKNNRRE